MATAWGRICALSLTRRAIALGDPPPRYLFVSGRGGPAVEPAETRHLLPKEAFREMLLKLGGCPPEVLADPDLADLFEPVLRADFNALGATWYEPSPPFDVPILVMTGSDDDVSEERAMAWQQETTSEIRLAQFPGGHFFINEHWSDIRRLMSGCLESVNFFRGAEQWARNK